VGDIHYFESCKNYARVFFGNQNTFVKKALSNIEARLPKQFFFRANRQYIVNLNSISTIEEAIGDGYTITMQGGKAFEVSRRSATALKERLSL